MAGDRPGVLAAQEPRPGPGVRAVVRHGARRLPGSHGRAVHRRPAAGDRPDPPGARTFPWHTGFQPRPVCQRPAVRGVVAAVGGHRRGVPDRVARPLHTATGTGADRAAAAARIARRAVQGRRRGGRADVRAAGLDGDRDSPATGSGLPGLGRFPPSAAGADRHDAAGRRTVAPVRAAAGPRWGQTLLARRRRGRQTDPRRRRLAGRTPRTRLDHPAIPGPPPVTGTSRTRPPRRSGRGGTGGARRGRGGGGRRRGDRGHRPRCGAERSGSPRAATNRLGSAGTGAVQFGAARRGVVRHGVVRSGAA